jgi:hypothetical protein
VQTIMKPGYINVPMVEHLEMIAARNGYFTKRQFAAPLILCWLLALPALAQKPGQIGVATLSAPFIVTQPVNQFAFEGADAGFKVQASASELTIQWQFKGRDLAGATNDILNLTAIQPSQAGEYRAVIRNSAGFVTSQVATLLVVPFEPLQKWTLRHQDPPPPPLNLDGLGGIVHGNGLFVAVGNGGAIVTSADGESWTRQVSGTNGALSDVTYGKGRFLAVSGSGPLTSVDGTNWARGTGPAMTSIQFINGGFVGASANGLSAGSIYFSEDGAVWRSISVAAAATSVTHGNGVYVAVGLTGFPRQLVSLTSPDGSAWTLRDVAVTNRIPFAFFPPFVTFVNDRFYATASEGVILTSPDGVSWTRVASGVVDEIGSLAYGPGGFVLVGGYVGDQNRPGTSLVLTSPDGLTWTQQPTSTASPLTDVAYGNGKFVAVGTRPPIAASGVAAYPIVVSPNGSRWHPVATPLTLRAVTYGGNAFIAVGDNGTILESPDGANWVRRLNESTAQLKDICFSGGTFVSVGMYGTILSSTNGQNWTERRSGTTLDLWAVTFANGTFVAVGGYRFVRDRLNPNPGDPMELVVLTSRDGIQWTVALSRRDWGSLVDVACGGGLLLGVGAMHFDERGDKAYMAQSADGVSWSRFDPKVVGGAYTRIEFGNDRFVAIGGSVGVNIATLTNRLDLVGGWAQRDTTSLGTAHTGLSFGRNTFFLSGKAAILVSADGLTWRRQETGHAAALYDIAFGKNTFVAVGENGTILQSAEVPDEAAVIIKDVAWQNGAFRLSVQTQEGWDYVFEFKNALEESVWQRITVLPGNGLTMQFFDANAQSRQRFYRIRLR